MVILPCRANGARSASHAGRRASTGSHRRHACRAQGDVAVDAGGPWHPEGDAAADAVHVHPRRANNPLPRTTTQGLSKPCKSWTYADADIVLFSSAHRPARWSSSVVNRCSFFCDGFIHILV